MSIVSLDIKDNNGMHFSMEFDRRINFIVGDSGSGKTTLYNMLDSSRFDSDITVKSTYSFVLATIDTYKVMIGQSSNTIFIFDDLDIVNDNDFAGLVKNYCVSNNLWFLIMSREDDEMTGDKKLSYSINNVFKLVSNGKDYHIEKYYSYDCLGITQFDKVLIEDTTSAYKFFSRLYKHDVVHSSNGKSSIVSDTMNLYNEGCKSILVLFDSAAFGCHMSLFDSYFSSKKDCTITIVSFYECFEELLLRTNLLNTLPVVKEELSHLTDYANNFISWERYFEDLIKRATETKMYKHSHSGNLRSCYYDHCSKCNEYMRAKCDRSLGDGDKFEELLRGTEYQFLLEYEVK